MWFTPLPWDYGVRNLLRRPLRSGLTLAALTTVTLLVLVVLGFIHGLERTLSISGDAGTAFVFSLGMGENLEYSSIPQRTAELLGASLSGIRTSFGRKYVSPELYLGTQVRLPDSDQPRMGLVRGVTPTALLVHDKVEIIDGAWPQLGEVLIGQLTATKLRLTNHDLSRGQEIRFEGRTWKISGTFAAAGSAVESEVWCRLDDLQQSMKRQDISLVTLQLRSPAEFADVDIFCKERLDLELQAVRQLDYFQTLQKDYAPVRWLAWSTVLLIAAAGVLVGLNAIYGAVVGRMSEIAMLQTIGFSRRAAMLSIMQEGMVLSMTAGLIASLVALFCLHGVAVGFTLEAFTLQMDGHTLFLGNMVALLLGVLGTIPPALRICRHGVVDGLKAV